MADCVSRYDCLMMGGMIMTSLHKLRRLIPFLLIVFISACSVVPVNPNASIKVDPGVNLTVWLIPGTGLEPMIRQYDHDHPELRIDILTVQHSDVHSNLQTAFAAGYGAPDVSVVESTFMERFRMFDDYFYNLYDYGAADIQSEYLDWKWRKGQNEQQSFVFGLPTDIGPLLLAYRKDVFKQAGLPHERDEVSALLTDWDDYLEVGQIIKDTTGVKMFNNLKIFFRTIFSQLETQYFDRTTGALILRENEELHKAWDYVIQASKMDLSANIETYLPEWGAALSDGDFAVMPAPSWMTGLIRLNAPDAAGKWDLALLPPQQYGNWGGSYLTLPREGQHPEEAYALILYLTSPERQLQLFIDNGNFPSTPGIYVDPAIRDKTDPYFGGVPYGMMYSEAANKVKPIYEGPFAQEVGTMLDEVLQKVDDKTILPDEAWDEVLFRVEQKMELLGSR
jgi:cellobiose transport system substrate-binding protein